MRKTRIVRRATQIGADEELFRQRVRANSVDRVALLSAAYSGRD